MPDPFKAYDIRGLYPAELNESLAYAVGNATAQVLKLAGKRYCVGRDMRLSGPALKQAFIKGLVDAGVIVVDLGMVSTPTVTFAMHHLDTAGGAQITASHNPGAYGGIKITAPGFKPVGLGSGLEKIEKKARACEFVKVAGGRVEEALVLRDYCDLLAGVWKPSRRLKIVVDGGNGIIGTLFQHLAPLLGDLDLIPLYFDPDGRFPHHEANPLKAENLAALQAKVKEVKADFGAGFDGDGDRCALVDETGAIVSSDLTTAILAKPYLDAEPGAAVAYDLRSSQIVPEMIRAWGGRPVETRVGHSFIKHTLKAEKAVLAGELSGHYYFRDFFGADSGLYAFCLLANAIAAAPSLSKLVAPLRKYHHSGELNFKVADAATVLARVKAMKGVEVTELDGVTVRAKTWWANVRASNTEPVVRLNLEANSTDEAQIRIAEMKKLITA